jgi:FkbM family methyltransferase
MLFKNIVSLIINRLGYQLTRIKKNKNVAINYAQGARCFLWLEPYDFKDIIDIGANEGLFAQKILTLFPNAKVHCFEPINSVFEQLKANLSSKVNVRCYNYGLGESEKSVEIFKNEYSPSSSLLPMLDLHKENFEFAVDVVPDKIEVRTLDSFFLTPFSKPLLVKIDVQGYEMFVLKGGNNVILQTDVIIIETTFRPLYEDQPLFHDIYQYLIDRGFVYAGNVEQLTSPKDNSILQADAVFVKSSFSK